MIDYVKISTTGNISGAKKYDVLELTTPIPYLDTPMTSGSTLSGNTYYSAGIGKKVWKFVAGIYYTDSRAGYASMSDALSIINAQTSTALSIQFQDWLSSATTYTVYMTNRGQDSILELVSATVDAASSFYKLSLEFRQA
jgi:hypothetical protein